MAAGIFPPLNPGVNGDPFTELCKRFTTLVVTTEGADTVTPIWDLMRAGLPTPPALVPEDILQEVGQRYRKAIEGARNYLPLPYQEAYIEPLLRYLGRIVALSDDRMTVWRVAEILAGAVAQHHPSGEARQPLRQYLAVVSNLYRSFLAEDRRVSAEIPCLEKPPLPPLVMFHHDIRCGPALLAPDMTQKVCGSEVPIVILPQTYSRTPLAWASLAHEACGHGVLRADADLLPELIAGIRTLFGGGPVPPGQYEPSDPQAPDKLSDPQALALAWSAWAEETASDVFGLLNIGPTFALNLAAYLDAVRHKETIDAENPDNRYPLLAVDAGNNPSTDLDGHPPDLLRLHVAIGAIQNLIDFPAHKAEPYLKALEQIIDSCKKNVLQDSPSLGWARVCGRVELARDRWVRMNHRFRLEELAESARRVGAFIATTRLAALNHRTVQELETWDTADEEVARSIRAALLEAKAGRQVTIERALQDKGVKQERIEEVTRLLGIDRLEQLLQPEITALELDCIEAMGDDAQLIAGATLAALNDSSSAAFGWINQRLACALLRSFKHDSIVGSAHLHNMVETGVHGLGHVFSPSIPPAETDQDMIERAPDVGVGARPSASRGGQETPASSTKSTKKPARVRTTKSSAARPKK